MLNRMIENQRERLAFFLGLLHGADYKTDGVIDITPIETKDKDTDILNDLLNKNREN